MSFDSSPPSMAGVSGSLGLTPPYRIGQNDTHVFVEVQCPDSPLDTMPEVACDETIFAMRLPPYYLPLHFPAPLEPKPTIHRMERLVRIDLAKTTAGLEFIGLDDLQPTLFADSSSEVQTSAPKGNDMAASDLLHQVLQREELTTVPDEERSDRMAKSKKGSFSIWALDQEEIQSRLQAIEEAENLTFDEEAYLDAFVDQDGEVDSLLNTAWELEDGAREDIPAHSSSQDFSASYKNLVLIEVLFGYHLALLHSSGPPLTSAWLLTSLSRTLSPTSAPPAADSAISSVLRGGYRRGLTYPLFRNWRLCDRATENLASALRKPQHVFNALQAVRRCLLESAENMAEGQDEAERCLILVETIVEPLALAVKTMVPTDLSQLADDVDSARTSLTKQSVAPSWDLELLEQMAQEVIEEEAAESERRLFAHRKSITDLCLSLCPPLELVEEGFDAFATPVDITRRKEVELWRSQTAPQLLLMLKKEVHWLFFRKRGWRSSLQAHAGNSQTTSSPAPSRTTTSIEDAQLMAQTLVTASRFLSASVPWSSTRSQHIAERFLQRRHLKLSEIVIRIVLADHIRPLFLTSALDPGVVDEGGRARHERAHLSKSTVGRGHQENKPAWKGAPSDGSSPESAYQSRGAGVHLTLCVCLSSIEMMFKEQQAQRGDQKTSSDPWEAFWPLLLPPLMHMLEDSDPRWRYRGTQLLLQGLLESSEKAKELLVRANLVPHIEKTLFDGLTYLSSPTYGVPLLDAALRSLRVLASDSMSQMSRSSDSKSKRLLQVEQRMRILQDGVLRVWSLAPRTLLEPPDLIKNEQNLAEQDQGQVSSHLWRGSEDEDMDLLVVTYEHLARLCRELGILSARYIDVCLEFLCAQAEACYDKIVVQAANDPSKTPEVAARRRRRNWSQAQRAVEAMTALVGACLAMNPCKTIPALPPNLLPWSGRVLSALVKTRLAISDAPPASDEHEQRQRRRLARIVADGWLGLWSSDVVKVAAQGRESCEGMTGVEETIRLLEGRLCASLRISDVATLFESHSRANP